jgi:8-oxo-dGTP pyrophosphatase MutT (NUDIX family)
MNDTKQEYPMTLPPFIQHLQQRLQEPLPGYSGQAPMAPLPARIYTPPEGVWYRDSAVMALLLERPSQSDLEIVFTVRSSDLKSHSGQISFAGGRCEDGETFVQAALRETHEEIGIPPEHILPLGELSPLYVPVSTSFIHPVVGFLQGEPHTRANPGEVEEVFFVQMSHLLNPENMGNEPRTLLGREVIVPFWRVHPTIPLWGATAMMVRELLTLYEEFLQLA